MKFGNKEVASLTDDELRDAIISVGRMDGFRYNALAKPKKRHEKIFANKPPVENPVFTNLVNELQNEFKSRNLTNV